MFVFFFKQKTAYDLCISDGSSDVCSSDLMLSLRQPFRANDHVVIEGHEGRVVRLTSRATILMTLEGNHLRIPNSTVFKAVILNYTRNPERRRSEERRGGKEGVITYRSRWTTYH